MAQDENTKENVMNIAINLFATKGYEAIGVQEICNVANITKPTLYYHFGSKTGILKEITDTKGNELVKLLLQSTNYEHDFQNSLTKIYKAVIEFAKENQEFFRLHCVLANSPKNSESYNIYKEVSESILGLYTDLFTDSCNEFGNMRGKEKLYSTLFCNNVNAVALSVLQNQLEIDEDTIYKIVHSFIYGVAS